MMMAEVRTNLRLPDEMYEQIKDVAGKDRRSINAQIVVLLQEALEERQRKEERK